MQNPIFSRLKLASILVLTTLICLSSIATAQAPLSLKRLKVSLWPEYDQPSLLVMYQGELADNVSLPARIKFQFPSAARLSSTSSINTQGKFEYTKEWNSRQTTNVSTATTQLEYTVYYPRFQFEVYYPIDTSKPERSLSYTITNILPVSDFTVEIQKPLKAKDMKIEPASQSSSGDERGFKYSNYSLGSVKAGSQYTYKISYQKATNVPSVSEQPGVVTTTERHNAWIIVVLFSLIVIAPLVIYFLVASKRTSPQSSGKFPAKSKVRKGKSGAKAKKFCSSCGEILRPGAKFCSACGAKQKS
jgi:hypothetical protein